MRAGRLVAAVAAALVAVGVAGVPAVAESSPAQASSGGFYTPPDPLPAGTHGDLIRSEPMRLAFSLPGIDKPLPAEATRIMYRSQDTHGDPVATTGTYLDPAAPWLGKGERPLVSYAVGTIGQGDQCAPSKLLNKGVSVTPPGGPILEYETPVIYSMLARGIGVVLTDYQGLGTPGTHTYVNRAAEGHAVLDAARAADRLPGKDFGKVVTWGYSQGGGASASAAELAAGYTPDVDIAGSYAGAVPADLEATLKQIDGTVLTGAIGYSINSLVASYPELAPLVDENLNANGKRFLQRVSGQCTVQTAAETGFHRTNEYTKSGQPADVVLARYPVAQRILAEQRIGNRKPEAPVLVQHGPSDDLVPYDQDKAMAKSWCGKGSAVQFSTIPLPPAVPGSGTGHVAPYVVGQPEAMSWLQQRFDGKDAPENCSSL